MARSLSPFGYRSDVARSDDPFGSLRREMNRMFEDTFGNFLAPMREGIGRGMLAPSVDVKETDKELEVTAELPGVDEKDVQVTLEDDVLTIKGEKKLEKEESREGYHVSERSYGSFFRSLPMPSGVDPNKVNATFSKGILKVTLPKPAGAQAKAKKIDIKAS